jgi:hypothetical protein
MTTVVDSSPLNRTRKIKRRLGKLPTLKLTGDVRDADLRFPSLIGASEGTPPLKGEEPVMCIDIRHLSKFGWKLNVTTIGTEENPLPFRFIKKDNKTKLYSFMCAQGYAVGNQIVHLDWAAL